MMGDVARLTSFLPGAPLHPKDHVTIELETDFGEQAQSYQSAKRLVSLHRYVLLSKFHGQFQKYRCESTG